MKQPAFLILSLAFFALPLHAQDMETLRRHVAQLQDAACPKVAPADLFGTRIRDENVKILRDVAAELVKQIDADIRQLDALVAAGSLRKPNRDLVVANHNAEKKALDAECPTLPAAAAAPEGAPAPPPPSPPPPPPTDPEAYGVKFSRKDLFFDSVEVSRTKNIEFDIVSTASDRKILIESVEISGADPGEFSLGERPCGQPIDTGQPCRVNVSFSPAMAGTKNAVLDIHGAALTPAAGDKPAVTNPFSGQVSLRGSGFVQNIATLAGSSDSPDTPSRRLVIGVDASGASSSDTQQKFFVAADLNTPLRFFSRHRDPLESRFWVFFSPRISSQPRDTAISSLDTSGSFFNSILGENPKSLVQSVDLLSGLEMALIKPRDGIPFWGAYRNTHGRIGMSWVMAWGISSPFVFNDSGGQSTQFVINDSIRARFNNQFQVMDPMMMTVSQTNILFVEQERSRFFRKFYAGLRFKTYFFSDRVSGECDDQRTSQADPKPCYALYSQFPGIFDLTFGQDETVTGGRLRDVVFRADAVYPLPFAPGFHIYGSVYSALTKNETRNPILLQPAQTPLALDNILLAIQPVPVRNRDYYRIGMGFDLVQFLRKRAEAGQQQPAAEPAKAADPVEEAQKQLDNATAREEAQQMALDRAKAAKAEAQQKRDTLKTKKP